MTVSQARTPDARNPTRMTALAVVMSSVLLASVAARADQRIDPSQADGSRPATTSASQAAGASADPGSTEVGSEKSNVDKDSSSGAYYPYSAGTVGDDPAEPTSTAVSEDTLDKTEEPKDQLGRVDSDGDVCRSQAELAKEAASLAERFDAMDADKDGTLTREEFKAWHESRSARLNAD